MRARSAAPSSAEIAAEANTLFAGLGILTLTFLPLAVPGLLLFVVAPLALVAVVGLVLAIPFVLPIWLARAVSRRRSRRGSSAGQGGDERRAIPRPDSIEDRPAAIRMRGTLRVR